LKWVIGKGINLGVFGQKAKTQYFPNRGGTNLIDGRALGFMDVLDAAGNVIFPAEAFLYGGRPSIVIPDDLPQYMFRPSNPEYQVGLNTSWESKSRFGINFSGNYNSDVCAARLCLTKIPAVTVLNAGMHKSVGNWDFKVDVTNLTDKHYYRPRQLNGSAELLVTAMPLRRTNITAKYTFK
jgi:iron complex outermembrane receptor protein